MQIKNEKRLGRIIDICAGGINWFIILLLLLSARYFPIVVSGIVTLYVIYWVYQSIIVAKHSSQAIRKIDISMKTDWLNKLTEEHSEGYSKIYQAILIPFANESIDIIDQTVEKIADANYPQQQKILALAPEMKIESGLALANKLQEKYKDRFFKIYVFPHTLVEGEIVGKASNQNNGAKQLYKELISARIDSKNVVITSLDSDMLIDKGYLSLLTYKFLEAKEDRFTKIFQPIPMNLTGMWETAAPAHMISSFGVQWFLSLVHRPFDFVNFAVYASCLQSVHEAGYWAPDIIPEDERFYWQMYFHTKGKVEVVPLFLPIFGSVIITTNYRKTLLAQYDQIRRWAWGVSETRYIVINMLKDTAIPWSNKFIKLFIKVRKNIEWVMLPIILGIGNFLPEWLNKDYKQSTIAFNIPILTSRMLTLTLFSFVVLFILIQKLSPKKPQKWKFYNSVLHYSKWVIFPLVSVIFGSIPALDAQTRLLFGKTIRYKTAPKTS